MANQSPAPDPKVTVTFARDLGLFDATMIGIGAMIGAGIFVLTGIAAGEAGPAAVLAFGLNGFVTLLTALSYAELASALPEAGGGYAYIKKAFPGAAGFLSGWMLWFCYVIACSLYALGFGSYAWEAMLGNIPLLEHVDLHVFGRSLPVLVITAAVGVIFVNVNMRGTALTGSVENVMTMAKIVILLVFVAMGVNHIFGNPAAAAANFKPFMPKGMTGVVLAMGLTFIAFEGYDLIATVAEEVRDPEKNLPRATMISLFVTVLIYVMVILVCIGAIVVPGRASWEVLGESGETAVVGAARRFMPMFGVALVTVGALLSTLSALNATILASSRVAFSMGRDRMLPEALGRIHPTRRTPHIAVFVTGVILIVVAMLFPIRVIGSAASVMFLLTFALVNLALIAIRRKFPEVRSGFRVPLYPLVPIVAIVLNLVLAVYQLKFDVRSWYIAAVWIGLGLAVYAVFARRWTAAQMPQVIDARSTARSAPRAYRILTPMHHPDHVIPLMQLAVPIAEARGGEIIVLGVADVPQSLPIGAGRQFIAAKQPLLQEAVRYGWEQGVPTHSEVRIAHRVYDGILRAAEEEEASLVLMGWKGYTTRGDRIFGEVADQVVRHAPCDLMTVKLNEHLKLDRILIPTAGGPHALLAAEFVADYQRAYGSRVACCYVVDEHPDEHRRQQADEWIDKTVHRTGLEGEIEHRIIESPRVATGLAQAAGDYDLIVLGASKEGIFSSVLFGDIPERVARQADTPVMIVRRYEGVMKTVVKKVMG